MSHKEFINKINQTLKEKLQIKNSMAIPKIAKVVINVGIGKTKENPKFKDIVEENLKSITGQKPKITKAKKAISGFKIRQGDNVGEVVTLRGKRMYDFIYKLANIVLPRVRDFRGLDEKGFDKSGNYNLAIKEQIFFPEIVHEKAEVLHGLLISITTTVKNKDEGKILLETFGFPFKKKDK